MKPNGHFLIGKTLGHTLSPKIHTLLGDKEYSAKEVCEEELEAFILQGEWSALNVTMPYKQKVMKYLDSIHPIAEEIGAVNTVVKTRGKTEGFNTDARGMEYSLKRAGISLKDRSVLILGSGGTFKTAEYVAKKQGAKIIRSVSRSGEINYNNCYECKDTQIVINATPVGMFPDICNAPVMAEKFENLEGIMDCVYNPLRTFLSQNARKIGIPVANGLDMLAEQARLSHLLFEGYALDELTMSEGEHVSENIVKTLVGEQINIVLIGMGGCGKTSVGTALAAAMGREFFDIDDETQKIAGENVGAIISKYGEKHFRETEKTAVRNVCKKRGVVISCGGGTVLDEENAMLLKSSGAVVLIERKELALRPLYPTYGQAVEIYGKRKDIYKSVADASIKNDKSVGDAVEAILQVFRGLI